MNGQISAPEPPEGGASRQPRCTHGSSALVRLLVALLLSCLLHIGLVVLPYLGTGSRDAPSNAHGAQGEPELPRAFVASLPPRQAAAPPGDKAAAPGHDKRPPAVPGGPPAESSHSGPGRSAGADLLPIPALPYYTADQLTKRPQPLTEAKLDTPELSQIISSGRIILKLWIDDSGEVVDVEVESSDLPEAFSRTAVAAFKQMRFVAGERHGRRVGSIMRIEVSYADGRLPPS